MYQRQVTFSEAVRNALTVNYCNFSGRASRSEFWWFALFTFILSCIVSLAFFWSDTLEYIVTGIINILLLLPGVGLSVRRLHDTNRSGWWVLINLVPVVGWIIFVFFAVTDSQPVPNQYGPVPNLVER